MVTHPKEPRSSRRQFITQLSAGALGLALPGCASLVERDTSRFRNAAPKSVAAVVTIWRRWSHADVILNKILKGWEHDGGPGPNLRLASLYVDQFPPGPPEKQGDMSRKTAEEYGVPIFDTIEGATTVGTNGVPVDGVLLIGEHGSYPYNDKGQELYPRRRFFSEVAATFEKHGRVVPVFNDKHLGPVWEDALWTYERAQQLKIPFMAGSSLPLTFRSPDISLPMGCEIETAVALSYAQLDRYCFHALEFLQTSLERRRGAETGVKSVQWLGDEEMWNAVDSGVVRRDVVDAALAIAPRRKNAKKLRQTKGSTIGLFLVEYYDGLTAAVFNLPGYLAAMTIAVKLKGRSDPIAIRAEERMEPSVPHFAYLLKAVERMFHTGVPTYPVERTLLTTGILDRALTSRFEGGRRLETPELAIRYTPVDYPHAPWPALS